MLIYVFPLFSGSAMIIFSIRAYGLYMKGSTVVHLVFMALYPISNMALYGSIYITLAVSIERFLGKCHFSLMFPKVNGH